MNWEWYFDDDDCVDDEEVWWMLLVIVGVFGSWLREVNFCWILKIKIGLSCLMYLNLDWFSVYFIVSVIGLVVVFCGKLLWFSVDFVLNIVRYVRIFFWVYLVEVFFYVRIF